MPSLSGTQSDQILDPPWRLKLALKQNRNPTELASRLADRQNPGDVALDDMLVYQLGLRQWHHMQALIKICPLFPHP
jgi:hypothetical protein